MTMGTSPQGSKRPRDEDIDICFTRLAEWIRGAGGIVHPSITMDKDQRELRVVEDIDEGTTVMQIPSGCLVTKGTIRSKSSLSLVEELKVTRDLYHSPQDIELAVFLAGPDAGDHFRQYLDSLPESSSFDALPRRWTDEQLKLLTGSPLLKRIKRAREGTLRDYKVAKTAWKDKNPDSPDAHFPSLQAFSDRMAAVSSRAFEGMKGFDDFGGKEGDTTLIPMLDLCNHHRGRKVHKNLAYSYEGAIIVHALQAIKAGDTLRITYGAQGNAQLLLNYGFCIPNNFEPDGSSNDVLEFYSSVADPTQVVHLRAGPKSYSYGGLVKALECFYLESQDAGNGGDRDEGPDDMEAFLNDCEEEEGEDFDWENIGDDFGDGEPTNDESIKTESMTLAALRAALQTVREAYTFKGNDLHQAAALTEASPQHFAALLIKSELRTLHFFLRAIHYIEKELNEIEYLISDGGPTLGDKDDALIEVQVRELARAYVQIRHADML